MSQIDDDVKGVKLVSRHILRKVTDNETLTLDVRAEVADLRCELTCRA